MFLMCEDSGNGIGAVIAWRSNSFEPSDLKWMDKMVLNWFDDM
jgi:hypothetical protein